MNWAHEQQWPAARVQGDMRYAIEGDERAWHETLVMARQDLVDALYETYVTGAREPLPIIDYERRGIE